MMNVTISMDDELHRQTRIEAAKAGKSMSRYIADKLKQGDDNALIEEEVQRRLRRLEALQRVFDGPKWDVTENGRMPNADERNARR